jgi:hypothetical protein
MQGIMAPKILWRQRYYGAEGILSTHNIKDMDSGHDGHAATGKLDCYCLPSRSVRAAFKNSHIYLCIHVCVHTCMYTHSCRIDHLLGKVKIFC